MKKRSDHGGQSVASIPQDGRVDVRKLDVAAKPKRNRRRRDRPAPDAELRQWEAAAERRAYARTYPPGIILEPDGEGGEHWTSPHNDEGLWLLQLGDALGTRSRAVAVTFMNQLKAFCGESYWDEEAGQWRLDENEFSAALALVNTIKPRNEMEAALAVQMVGVHIATMKMTAHAIKHDYDPRNAAVASKLARTFTLQMAELRAGRTRKTTVRQSIKVRKELHQHVHYHDDRGASELPGQPRGRATSTIDQCAALPSPDEGRDAMPPTCIEGQGSLQAPRRKIARRSQG